MRTNASKPPVVYIATSAGGHIELMVTLRAAFDGYRRVWLAQPSLRAQVLAREGEEVIILPEYDRNPLRGHHVRNILQAAGIVLRRRPRVVVTSGAGATVPFCALARLTGARVVFVETTARVTGPSSSGKVLSRLASRVLVQWSEAARFYPRTTVCRPALLRTLGERRPGEGVFVGVGEHSQPFDRLLRMVDRAVGDGVLPGPVVAQSGPSAYRPSNYEPRAWLAPDEVATTIAAAQHVICHAGSGLMSTALRAGRRPLVLARRAAHGEHYDDHQTQLVEKLAALGLVVPLGDAITAAHLDAASAPLRPPASWALQPDVADAVRAELESVLGPAPGRPDAVAGALEPVASISTSRRIA